jgi:hypothetical protein
VPQTPPLLRFLELILYVRFSYCRRIFTQLLELSRSQPSDPGITVNIYNNSGQPYPSSGEYTIPGKTPSQPQSPSMLLHCETSSIESNADAAFPVSGPAVFSCGASNLAAVKSSMTSAGSSSTSSAMTTFSTSYQPSVATSAAPENTSEDCGASNLPESNSFMTSAGASPTSLAMTTFSTSYQPSVAASAAPANTPGACGCPV